MQSDRLHVSVTSQLKQKAEELQKASGAASVSAVFADAIKIYDLILETQKNGGSIAVCAPDGTIKPLHFVV